VFLGLTEGHQSAQTQFHRANCDRAANTTVNVLPVTDLHDRRSRNAGNLFSVIYESHLVLVNEQMEGGTDVRAVLNPSCSDIEEQLAIARSFEDRIRIAERFLLRRIPHYPGPDRVAVAVQQISASKGAVRIDDLVATSGWTVRHFERRFLEQIGVAPKLYARIVRLNQALGIKLASPETTWTQIAHDLCYYDQMHMIHEFQQLAGDSPAVFVARVKSQPAATTTPSLSS